MAELFEQDYEIKMTDDSGVHSCFFTIQILFKSMPLDPQSVFSLGVLLPV